MDKKGHDFWRAYSMFLVFLIIGSIGIGFSYSSWIIGFTSYFVANAALTPVIMSMFIND